MQCGIVFSLDFCIWYVNIIYKKYLLILMRGIIRIICMAFEEEQTIPFITIRVDYKGMHGSC